MSQLFSSGCPSIGASASASFLEFPCFLYDPANVGSSAFSKPSLYIWKFSIQVLLKPSLKDFEHNFTSMWNEHSCLLVRTVFGIALLWDCNEKWPFQSVATAEFSKFAGIWSAWHAWVQILAPFSTICATLVKLLKLCEPVYSSVKWS